MLLWFVFQMKIVHVSAGTEIITKLAPCQYFFLFKKLFGEGERKKWAEPDTIDPPAIGGARLCCIRVSVLAELSR